MNRWPYEPTLPDSEMDFDDIPLKLTTDDVVMVACIVIAALAALAIFLPV